MMMCRYISSAGAYFGCFLLLGQAVESASSPPPQGYTLKDMPEIIAAGVTSFLAAHYQTIQRFEAPSDAGIAGAAQLSLHAALDNVYKLEYTVFFFDSSGLQDCAIYADSSLVNAGCNLQSPPSQCADLGGVLQSSTSITVHDVAKSWVVIYTRDFILPNDYCPRQPAPWLPGPVSLLQYFCSSCTTWQNVNPWLGEVTRGLPDRTRYVQAAIDCIKWKLDGHCERDGGYRLVRVIVVVPSKEVEGGNIMVQLGNRRPGHASDGNVFIADGAVYVPHAEVPPRRFPLGLYVVVGILPAMYTQQLG